MSGGRKTATTASTPSSSTAACSAARNCSAPPLTPMSIGASCASSRPSSRTASATRTPIAVELPTMATRGPFGSGWWASTVATSNICATVSTRMTPAEANSAATDCSGTATDVPSSPGVTFTCRPLFTATTGLVRPTVRASRANFRGLPKLSRCRSTTSVAGSVAQYWSRSLPLTSARLPAETNVDRPRLRLRARSRSATPRAPDWAKNPTRPRPGTIGARLAFSRTSGSVFTMPRQFGPTTRIPEARAAATSRPPPPPPPRPRPPGARGAPPDLPLRRPPLRPGLAEPAGDDHESADPLTSARLHHVGDLVGRDGEDGEVEVVGDRRDVGVGRNAPHVAGAGVDRVDRAREAVVEQVPEQGVADLAVVVAGAHDRDRGGLQQPGDRP